MTFYLFRSEAIRAAVQYARQHQSHEVLVPKFRRDWTGDTGYVIAVYDHTGVHFNGYL